MTTDTGEQPRWVYSFGGGSAAGNATMKNLLGGKGANLAEMSSLGLPVPPGFTVTTDACNHYYAQGGAYPKGLAEQVAAGMAVVEQLTGKRFGDPENPAGIRAVGRPGLDARHDGHCPQSRSQ